MSDKARRRLEQKFKRQEQTKRNNALEFILADPRGRFFVWEVLALAGAFRNPFVAGDPHGTSFNAGAQNVGQTLLARIPPAAFMEMQKEALEEDERRNIERTRVAGTDDDSPGDPDEYAGDD